MRLAAVPLVALLVGCADQAAGPIQHLLPQGLVETVQLSPENPTTGEWLTITSVVSNRDSQSVAVSSRVCGLDFQSATAFPAAPVPHCATYSMSSTLQPGDSITGEDVLIVKASAGRYILRVRQMLDPEAWVEVPVLVK
jgi:hypothetical protein